MNTTQLKTFAAEARKSLLSGVKSKMNALGFKDNGTVDERDYPIQAPDGTLFQNEIYDVAFYGKWMRLRDEIARYGFRQVCEEGAYTWFNRLVAIQILSRNGLIDPVLEFESSDVRIPLLVKQAQEGIRPEMPAFDAMRLNAVIDDDNRITEQFAILIVAYCQSKPILYKCFGTLNDFTELLLPTNILAANGFLNLLNGSTFITEDDYKTTELIGWLYQFYISERKDEVFASFKSGHKAEAEDIPAATQIFTPNWIVKYMVQNTLGRIYLDNNPDSTLKDSWQYLVAAPEPSVPEPVEGVEGPRLKLSSLEDYTFADLSCGSGHILGEAFDLLYAIYIEEGYTRRQAIKAIFQRNLLGIDIDTRAKQLATFTLMLKACQQRADAINCEVMPRVLDMTGLTPPNYENLSDTLPHFFLGSTAKTKAETIAAINLMQQADNLGSIMKFVISPETRAAIAESMKRWEDEGLEDFEGLFPAMRLILALTDKYAAVVMNPPYMGNGNMNPELNKYVRDNYEKGKADLCTVFLLMQAERTMKCGYYANIVPPSWPFISTFEPLRQHIIDNQCIQSFLHLSRGVFGADFGSVSTVFQNEKNENAKGTYFRLVERTFQEFDQKHLKLLFEKTIVDHDFRYYFADYTKDISEIVYSKNGAEIYYPAVRQTNFKAIPGCLFGYWLSDNMLKLFQKQLLSETNKPRAGLSTTDNNRFLRFWFEVALDNIYFEGKNREDLKSFKEKWVPMTKGGTFRKWYGNHEYILNFENDGEELKYWLTHNPNDPSTTSFSRYIRNYDKYCEQGISFSDVACGNPHFRWENPGLIPNSRGPYIYTDNKVVLGFLNGKVAKSILELLCPTLTFNVGDIGRLPYTNIKDENITNLVNDNISISKQDWDAHETSWDFQENELVRVFKEGKAKDLQAAVSAYKEEWEKKFDQLHDNEEELNRQFIEIYGLQEELTPEVPLEEVTILQQGEITIE